MFFAYGQRHYRQKMHWSQNIPHKVVTIQQLTGEEIAHLQSSWIPKQSDHHLLDVDQSPRHFRDV
jgi:hypothetical protein